MKKLHIRPAKGFVVRDPETKEELPAEGARVPDTAHWRRRLDEGQVERVDRESSEEKFDDKGSDGKFGKAPEGKGFAKGSKGR